MPIYKGNTKIGSLVVKQKKIFQVYKGGTKVFQGRIYFPTEKAFPSSYTETLYAKAEGQTYQTGTINSNGWYRIATRAETGDGQWSSARGGATGGCISDAFVWLWKDSKYIIWGANRRWTGYPTPTGNSHGNPWTQTAESGVLGGCGTNGCNWTEAGGGGGGAGGHGMTRHNDAGAGGGGTGCIIGINNKEGCLTESWNHAGFSVTSLECMVLAGGGGSNSGDNGEPRPGGRGGGAWGNGGRNPAGWGGNAGSGPGGTWGQGENGSSAWWAGPSRGAWCFRDYTRSHDNTPNWQCGVGIKSGSSCNIGCTYIYKLNY